MNILIINHYAGYPEMGMEYRPFYLGREWVKYGHSVTVIGASFSHVRNKQPRVVKDFTEEDISGIRYVWLRTRRYKGNGVGRILNMVSFVSKLLLQASKISLNYKPDVVIASSTYPLDNYPALRIARKNKAIHVFEVHDLWPLSPMELGGFSKHHPFIKMMQIAENYAYKNADVVISMLPKTLDYMKSHGLDPRKWHYIPNGINPSDWKKDEILPEELLNAINESKEHGNRIIGYAGSIGLANALGNLVNAAAILRNEPVRVFIVGDGPEKAKLITKVTESGVNNVIFFEPVSRRCIPAFLDHCDLLYIGLQRQPLFRFGISPNKLLDYMMAGKPVIQAIDAGNNMVGDAGCGLSIEPENPDELANAIMKVLSLTENERLVYGEKGHRYVLQNHDYGVLAEKMIEIFGAHK